MTAAVSGKRTGRGYYLPAVFAVYCVLTFIGALTHELWFDEAQSWCLVRDFDLAGFWENLRYEGHPALWYLILMPFAKAGLPCSVIPFISWFFSALAAAVVLFRSPFDSVLKTAVVFSGGSLFYNSVISRPYCLIQLFLYLIAAVYPERKKRPLLYGLLVALLCNTHICMSGLVGILGIYMIVDLMRDRKDNSKKQNLLNLCGLFIAGLGVIALVLPMLSSASLNTNIADRQITFGSAASAVLGTFAENSQKAVFGFLENDLVIPLVSNILGFALVFILILMRHYRRPFVMLLFFCALYIVSTEIVWVVLPNRAYCFLLTFVFAMWIGITGEREKHRESAANIKTDSKIIKWLVDFVIKADRNCRKSISVLLCAVLFATAPIGAYDLFRDYFKSFAASKAPAEYMLEHFEKGTVFVTDEGAISQVCCYLPEDHFKFYCIRHNEFHKIKSYKALPEQPDTEKAKEDLEEFESVYYLRVVKSAPDDGKTVIYAFDEASVYNAGYTRLEILELSLDDITSWS